MLFNFSIGVPQAFFNYTKEGGTSYCRNGLDTGCRSVFGRRMNFAQVFLFFYARIARVAQWSHRLSSHTPNGSISMLEIRVALALQADMIFLLTFPIFIANV